MDHRLATTYMTDGGALVIADSRDTEVNVAALLLRHKIWHNLNGDCFCSSRDVELELALKKLINQLQSRRYASAAVMLSRWVCNKPSNVVHHVEH